MHIGQPESPTPGTRSANGLRQVRLGFSASAPWPGRDRLVSAAPNDVAPHDGDAWDKIAAHVGTDKSPATLISSGRSIFSHDVSDGPAEAGAPTDTSQIDADHTVLDTSNNDFEIRKNMKRYTRPHPIAASLLIATLGVLAAAAAYITTTEGAAAESLIANLAAKHRLATIDNNLIYGSTNYGGLKAE